MVLLLLLFCHVRSNGRCSHALRAAALRNIHSAALSPRLFTETSEASLDVCFILYIPRNERLQQPGREEYI